MALSWCLHTKTHNESKQKVGNWSRIHFIFSAKKYFPIPLRWDSSVKALQRQTTPLFLSHFLSRFLSRFPRWIKTSRFRVPLMVFFRRLDRNYFKWMYSKVDGIILHECQAGVQKEASLGRRKKEKRKEDWRRIFLYW